MLQTKLENGCDKTVGVLLYQLASAKLSAAASKHRGILARYIAEKKMEKANLEAAIKYITKVDAGELNTVAMEAECGIGIVITKEIVQDEVKAIIEANREQLSTKRYTFDIGSLLKTLRFIFIFILLPLHFSAEKLKWADGKDVKDELDAQILALLGAKTEKDAEMGKQALKEKAAEKAATSAPAQHGIPQKKHVDHGVKLSPPDKNRQLKPEILQAHLSRTGGKYITRFPPEPNVVSKKLLLDLYS